MLFEYKICINLCDRNQVPESKINCHDNQVVFICMYKKIHASPGSSLLYRLLTTQHAYGLMAVFTDGLYLIYFL